MRFVSSLALLAGMALSTPIFPTEQKAPAPGYRLLQVSEDRPAFWVAPEIIDVLGSSELDFIDITEHQFPDPSKAPSVAIPSGPSHQAVVAPLLFRLDIGNFERDLTKFTSFRNRYYTSDYGVESSDWLFNYVSEISENRTDIIISRFSHSWKQSSVTALIRGRASTREKVIIGAHQDSISSGMPTGSAPGADDDGSGSMGILEIFRVLATSSFRPENDIEFHWYSAEEVGLLGSQDIAKRYSTNGVPVRGMIQMDMIGYDVKESTVGLVTDYTNDTLNAFVRNLVDEYLQISWTNTLCGYGCSDHASWNRYGYPSAFPFEAQFRNRNPQIHTPFDTIDKVSMKHALQFIRLGLSFVVELSFK